MVADATRRFTRQSLLGGAHWLVGGAVTVAAGVIATFLAIVLAATVALAAVVVGGALATWAVALRVRQATRTVRPAPIGVVLEARKVGHAWVAYG